MTIEKVPAWRTSDGQYFEKQDDAKAHEFELQFREYWKMLKVDMLKSDDDDVLVDDIGNRIIDDKDKLLPIFKLLNGGMAIEGLPPATASSRTANDG